MKMIRKVFMMAIVLVFSFSSFSIGADPEDPNDPRWYILSDPINPKGTYFRTCQDQAHMPTILDMFHEDYDISLNEYVVMKGKGAYVPGPGYSDVQTAMAGIFSPSGNVQPNSETRLNRVPDAVGVIPAYPDDAGTAPTWFQCGDPPENLTTDIPKDFWLCCSDRAVLVKVPARFLLVSGVDGYWKDNYDPNLDYKIEFSDDVKWHQHSKTCSTCWNDRKNWDVEVVPIPEVGVTFDTPGHTDVTNANSIIKYLRIVAGEVKFIDPSLYTTVCDAEKVPFIVAGGKMSLTLGDMKTCRGYIGYKNKGELIISEGGFVEVDETLTIGVDESGGGWLTVAGLGSLLRAKSINFGDEGYATIEIRNKGQVYSYTNIYIGAQTTWTGSHVTIESDGGLGAGGDIFISDQGTVIIDGGRIGAINLFVLGGGTLKGCDSGIVSANVEVYGGGTLGSGCSIGKLIIDGDYIQKAGGILEVEVAGYQQEDDYDVLEVTGNVTLDGTVQLDFINGFSPKKGDVFEFMIIGGTVTGSFSDVVINGLGDGFRYDISIEGGVTKLTALNDGDTKKFPWAMFLPAFIGSE